MKTMIVLSLAALLSACAGVVASNSRTVTIAAGAVMGGKALAMADAECKKYGRVAQLAGRPSPHEFVYDCVSP